MSYKWPGIPNGDYSFDHGRAVWNKIINYLRRLSEKLDADIVDATADRRGMMTAADKDKLDGVEPGAEVNQNAFSGVKVGNSTIEADVKTDVLELVAGTNISLAVDTTNDKVTITNTYEHPTYTARTGKPTQDLTPGFGDTVTISQIVSDGTGHVTAANDKTITIPSTEASQSTAGLMSATDKTKLDGIASGAEVNQNAFSNIQVGPATVAADSKTDTLTLGPGAGVIISANTTNDSITIGCVEATQSVPGIMSTADKTKLDGISAGAEVNQNTFAIVKVGSTNVTADAKQDTLTLIEGSNVTLSPNATNDSITIAATDTVYTHPTYTARTGKPATDLTPAFGGTVTVSQVESDGTGHVTGMTDRTITIPATEASSSAAGLVTTGDQTWAGSKTIANSSDTGWGITYGSGSSLQTMRFEIGSSHVNRGIWDDRLNKWVFHCDNSKCYVGGYSIEKSVPSNAEFTDTVTTVTSSGAGNAVTSITSNNGALTVEKGSTFSLSGHTHDYFPLQTGIPNNSNLDNYKTTGIYYCTTNASAETISNRPSGVNSAFTLFVLPSVTTQILITFDGAIYKRWYRSWDPVSWSSWVLIGPVPPYGINIGGTGQTTAYNAFKALLAGAITNTTNASRNTSNVVNNSPSLNYACSGQIVHAAGYFQLSSQLAAYSEKQIATGFPKAIRGTTFMCYLDSSTFYGAYVGVSANGNMYMCSRAVAVPANTWIACNVVYLRSL